MADSDNEEQVAADIPAAAAAGEAAAGEAAAGGAGKYFKLPDFWPSSIAAWFGVAEAQFDLRGVTSQRARFGLVASILPEASAKKVTHLLQSPSATCYDDLKKALLSSHLLSEVQRMDMLFNMDPLGSRRPSDLLSEMLELVDPGEEKTKLFARLFLRRLPAPVRVQLTEDDLTDLRSLAEKADRKVASLAKQAADAVLINAATAPAADSDNNVAAFEELSVSAARFNGRGRGRGKGRGGWNKNRGGGGGRNNFGGGNNFNQKKETPVDIAIASSGLCRSHFIYGETAHSCQQPCSWQGN